MEEILPAARLLSQATAVTPSDYEHAKAVFLRHVQSAGAAAENLSKQARNIVSAPHGVAPAPRCYISRYLRGCSSGKALCTAVRGTTCACLSLPLPPTPVLTP